MKQCITQNWIKEAVKEFLGKQEVTRQDLEQIRYMKIGEGFDNTFVIELSVAEPPVPFADPMGGDEWECCAVYGENVKRFVETNQNDGYGSFYGTSPYELSTIAFLEEQGEIEFSEEVLRNAESFYRTIFRKHYYEKKESIDVWEKWYADTRCSFLEDIGIFSNLKVLRIQGGYFKDLSFVGLLENLEVLELVETKFETQKGFHNLASLTELCCWCD